MSYQQPGRNTRQQVGIATVWTELRREQQVLRLLQTIIVEQGMLKAGQTGPGSKTRSTTRALRGELILEKQVLRNTNHKRPLPVGLGTRVLSIAQCSLSW